MGAGALFDLEEQFGFYGAYHTHPMNLVIHVIFVWPLLFSILVFCAYSPPFVSTPPLPFCPFSGTEQYVIFNLAFVLALLYATCYLLLDKKGGWVALLLLIGCWLGANGFVSALGRNLAWKVALAIQIIGWASQFFGHFAFEGRRPALFDNLVQALLTAPYFVLLEVMQKFFGYEPNPGFHQRMQLKIKQNIDEHEMKKEM
ncbi:hypothetical protein CBR_g36924 [Chara braunii]|uniref:Uncharacterized protein n=1 Tax=Chara braunii TaxID=69332 RepID=A0A388JZG1_CHABU|nr:hypothetical protein CBR_g36924 [Chara braunii]|eukprot:GBG63155.1 hypothetical protein CBR_g36924 [Chara braunii]